MIRNLFLALLALGLSLAGTLPVIAETRTPSNESTPQVHPHSNYTVFYRHDHHHPWRVYGEYRSHHDAHHAADHLRRQGHDVRIEQSF